MSPVEQTKRDDAVRRYAVTGSGDLRGCARTKCRSDELLRGQADISRCAVAIEGRMAQKDRMRIARHAEHRRERQTFAAMLDRRGHALLLRLQMRIRVRLHAELGHEQHQRQHVNEQAMRSSGQDFRPPALSIYGRADSDNPCSPWQSRQTCNVSPRVHRLDEKADRRAGLSIARAESDASPSHAGSAAIDLIQYPPDPRLRRNRRLRNSRWRSAQPTNENESAIADADCGHAFDVALRSFATLSAAPVFGTRRGSARECLKCQSRLTAAERGVRQLWRSAVVAFF